MPDITNPSHPRPPRKKLANGNNMYYDAEKEWESGTEVFFYFTNDQYQHPLDGVYILFEGSSQFEVIDGCIV